MNQSLLKFAQQVYTYCGLNYLNNLETLHFKMDKHLQKHQFSTYEEYLRYVSEHPMEWTVIVEILTINETYFYREEKQFKALMEHVILPNKATFQQPITIWSAACSTGEEPYSIIMNALDYEYPLEKLQMLATDINEQVLATAQTGMYFHKSLAFRRIPNTWKASYFEVKQPYLTIKENIKAQIEFDYLNLVEFEHYPPAESMDVIFCRNVLIYFDDATIEQILQHFYRVLKPGGYLFLGHSEMITKYETKFKTINDHGTFFHRKDLNE